MFFDTPDISDYRTGNSGVEYVHTFYSGVPGPHVCINALTHGNEICGAWAVDALLREEIRPVKGSLSLSFANTRAFAGFSAEKAEQSRWVDEDFNRLWNESTLDGDRTSAELVRARELREFFASVDYLLDLHSMHTPGPALGLCGPTNGGLVFALRMGMPGHLIIDSGHSAGRRLRDFADFSDENSPRQAYLVECGFHFDPSSVDVAHLTARRFLDVTGVCPGIAPVSPTAEKPLVTRITDAVTIHSNDFRFFGELESMQIIPETGTLIAYDGTVPVTTPYENCVIVMPAPERYRLPGMTAVRLGQLRD